MPVAFLLTAACAWTLAIVSTRLTATPSQLRPAALAGPRAVPSTTAPLVAFTSDYGQIVHDNGGATTPGGFDTDDALSVYEGEAAYYSGYNALLSTRGSSSQAQVYVRHNGDDPVRLTCDQRIKSHPSVLTYYGDPLPGSPLQPLYVVVAYSVRASYTAAVAYIEVDQYIADYAYETDEPKPPVPTPSCATSANISHLRLAAQTGDNEWPTLVPTNGVPDVLYSSTRDNALGDIYLQGTAAAAATRLTNGTADAVANTQPTVARQNVGHMAVFLTTTAFRADGSLGTFTYDPAAPAVQPVTNAWQGETTPQSDQAFAQQSGAAPIVYYRSTGADPFGDIYSAQSVPNYPGSGYNLPSANATRYAGSAGIADTDPGVDAYSNYYSDPAHDRDVLGASIDGVVADDPAQRGTIVEKDDGATAPSRYDTSAPSYSPDGTKLVYSQANATVAQIANGAPPSRSIYVADSDGTNPVRLTQASGDNTFDIDTNPTWSPDGRQIAFQRITEELLFSGRHVRSSVIDVVPADASSAPAAAPFTQADRYLDGSPSYSPDGTYLTMSRTPVADVTATVTSDAAEIGDNEDTMVRPVLVNNGAAPAAGGKVVINFNNNGLVPTASGPCTISRYEPIFQVTCVAPGPVAAGASTPFAFTVTGNGSTDGPTTVAITAGASTTSTENRKSNNTGDPITVTVDTTPPPPIRVHIARPHLAPPDTAGAAPTPVAPIGREGVRGVTELAADQPSQIWIADPASTNAAALSPPACPTGAPRTSCAVSGRTPAWSPDGKHLAYEAAGTVYDATLENVDGDAALEGASSITAVTGFTTWQPQSAGAAKATGSRSELSAAADPAWWPDGKSLLVTAQPAGSPDRSGIYRVDTNGTEALLVAQGPGPESEPTVQASADLAVAVSATPTSIFTNQQTTVTATVTNNGPGTVGNATAVFTLPTGLTPGAVPAGCTIAGQTVTCTIAGPLAVGGTATVSITVVGGTAGNYDGSTGGQPPISVTVSAPTLDGTPANNTATASVLVRPRASLNLTLTADPQTAKTGADITFTATVSNDGAGAADATTLEVSVPAGVDPPTALNPTGGTAPTCVFTANPAPPVKPGGTVNCDLGSLAGNSSQIVTFKATSEDANDYLFESTVTTTTPESGENTQYANVPVRWTSHAGLSVLIDAVPQNIALGDQTTVTATVTNTGPDTAGVPEPSGTLGTDDSPPPSDDTPPPDTNPFATLTIQLPAGMSVPAPPTGCTLDGTTLTCQLAPFAAGETRTFTFTATGQTLGEHRYDAAVDSSTTDDDPSDNTASTTVTVVRRIADLSVTIVPSVPSVAPGTSFDAVVTVRNAGPYPAENATLTTKFDARLQPTSAPACLADGTACSLGTVASGGELSFVVTLDAKHDGSPPKSYTAPMSATVATTTAESDPTNNSASATVRVIERDFVADVAVTITLPPVAYVGGTVKATVRVTNLGPQPAAKVRLVTSVPARLNAISFPLCVTGTTACQLGQLAPGASRTFTLRLTPARIKPARSYAVIVSARVVTTTTESKLANNRDEARLPVRQPRIRLLPPVGSPGFVTLAFAENLPPGALVALRWRTGVTTYAGPYRVDPDGTLTAPMQIVRRDELGPRRLVLNGKPGLFGKIGATMLVVPSQGSPPRFFGRG